MPLRSYTSAIEQRKAQISEMTSELERVTSRYGQLEDEVTSLQASLNELLYFKQRHSDRIQARQKYIKRLREISATTAVGSELDVVEVERKLSLSLKSIEDVRDVINDLKVNLKHALHTRNY
jgi:chromosome segregation ATPase